jgi:transcriptional regulator with XRE-family HTH domain
MKLEVGKTMKTMGQKLKELRNSLDLSQEILAEQLGVSLKSIQRYESGKYRPDTYALVKLATCFDVSTDYLLGLQGFKEDLKEISNKVFQDGKYNAFYSRYLKCKNSVDVDRDAEYYWIHSEEKDIIGGQTEWIGWFDKAHKIEIRRLRPVIPMSAIKMCTDVYERPMLLNEEEDAIVFRIFGGHAIVKQEICKRYLPEFLKDFIGENPEEKFYA